VILYRELGLKKAEIPCRIVGAKKETKVFDMTITLFISLVTVFATATSLITEATKKVLDGKGIQYASNIVVCIVAAVVGIGGTAAYYALTAIPFTGANIVSMILMGVAVAVGSMVGYDKVMQAIKQIKKD